MKTSAIRNIPFFAASVLLLGGLFWIGLISFTSDGRPFTYTLDDPYIHMAMAKNLALHNVFGVTRYEFSSSTSSPLWTLLLAASNKIVGVDDWLPGAWAVLFALGSLFLTNVIGQQFHLTAIARFAACLSVAYFTPLIPLASTGMEHTMHLFLILLLFHRVTSSPVSPGANGILSLCLAASLATAARYESLFVVGPLVFLLFAQRRFTAGLAIFVGACLPLVIYGLFSIAHGGYVLPNSIMLKGRFQDINGLRELAYALGVNGIAELIKTPHLCGLCALLLLSALFQAKRGGAIFGLSLALLVSVVLHLQFAKVGMFYRYEAYLVGAGVIIVSVACMPEISALMTRRADASSMGRTFPVFALGLLLLWPLHARAMESLGRVGFASRNIYEQQYQLGQFLKTEFPPGTRVALNDLGAMTYYADIRVLDLAGLGSIEVTRARRGKQFDTDLISGLLAAHGTELVIVYTRWFQGEKALPASLRPVGTWTINHNYVCGGTTVTFFGTSRSNAGRLRKAFRHFSQRLPDSVHVEEIKSSDAKSPAGNPAS